MVQVWHVTFCTSQGFTQDVFEQFSLFLKCFVACEAQVPLTTGKIFKYYHYHTELMEARVPILCQGHQRLNQDKQF